MNAIAGGEDGARCPAEGEVAGVDVAEGGLGGGGGGGREWCEVGDSGGVRGTEQALVCVGGEDVCEPVEGKMIIFKRWGGWLREVGHGAVKEQGYEAGVDGVGIG